MQARIAAIISEYSAQGIHRTGTRTDNESADWLADRISALGVQPRLETFPLERLDILDARFKVAGIDIEGVPAFDCTYTDASGITGSLGVLGSAADIGVVMASPMGGQGFQAIEAARRERHHKAIVLVTDIRMPADGAALINADSFLAPYGPPVLQVANRHWPAIERAARDGETALVIAHCRRVQAMATNVQATITGKNSRLAPLVVMTPRSGWWHCAAERGGGIAAFLEMIRTINSRGAARDVIFTANSGHELGHLGLDRYLESHKSLIAGASMWIHLGANFAAKYEPGVRLQFADDRAKSLVERELLGEDLKPAHETPIGSRPYGEARNIFDGGGRYISILGSNGLFHHPDDVWPEAVDMFASTRWLCAFTELSVKLAGEEV